MTDNAQRKPIPVTQPFLPPLDEFIPYLEQIWENKWLTNNGPFHQQLEKELCQYLGVEHISLFTNGTIALVTALQALRIGGEVITTPYSFVATSHALLWNNLRPVFVDVDPDSFNMDPACIEAAITPQTTAILAVHCYGKPCAVEEIQRIADTYGLRVIYDAAHAFGIDYKGSSLLNHGDLSILSFHATKVFNTFEGGAIVCPDAKTKQRIDYLKNFGFADEITVTSPGINGKMSEFQAAFGLLQLKHVAAAITARQQVDQRYRDALQEIPGISLPPLPDQANSNYSYFPILVNEAYPLSRDALYDKLRAHGVLSRRYFYPLISDMPMYRGYQSARPDNLPYSVSLAKRVLCLPIFTDLTDKDQNNIIELIRG
ncbi:DegT/DnrJ/EryC1/StrS aminotransferase family protein [Aquitalea sp. ASV15]|uniref:DegT/DnrJ/EryC1/StrS family aminotransferase n=1 Tax=Aquitalea sp. ASV15 TaxID=2795104 RepID=UPI0018ED47B7|nr:DegT/DnrJ/EryC1/StrS family aminotransferase [Aquitalea sp. ASV15]